MVGFYNKVYGNLVPGRKADVHDVNMIQTNIADALKSSITTLHHHDSFILGSDENAFLLSPAPKRNNEYIDTMNLSPESQDVWIDLNKQRIKQGIKKSKSTLYSIVVKLRNLSD